jgi:hypothetical protein
MLAREHSMVYHFFAIIAALATGLAPIWLPNIDDVTCLLTLPVALQRSQYQVMAVPFQGSQRSCKHPITITIINFIIIASIACLVDAAKKWKILVEIIVHECATGFPQGVVMWGSGGENLWV